MKAVIVSDTKCYTTIRNYDYSLSKHIIQRALGKTSSDLKLLKWQEMSSEPRAYCQELETKSP